MGTTGAVNTGRVTDRRKLVFATPDELLADADRVAAADTAGTLKRTGNWTAGQVFGHLAAFIDYAYDGYPKTPPWIVRALLRGKKAKYLKPGGLPRGVRIPGAKGGTWGIEPIATAEGLARLRTSWVRLREHPPAKPNPIFGPMSHDEWIRLHLRHAELHLGFMRP